MKKNILVRAPNWVGDIMLATPALSALRKTFPDARISALIKTTLAPLLEDNGDVDEIISFSPEDMSLAARIGFYHKLRLKKFDLAVLLTNSFESALAAFLVGAKERLGYNRDLRGFLLTKAIKTPPRSYPRMHQSEYYLNLIKAVGGSISNKKLKFNVPENVSDEVERLWKELGLTNSRLTVGFGVSAAYGSAKMWSAERFTRLGNSLVKELGGKIVVFGSRDDQELAEKIVNGMEYGGISMAGKTTLKSLAGMIKKCDIYITNDSGPMHIASALDTPVVAIFGPTDPSETAPLSDFFSIIRKESDCAPCWKRECPTDHRCMDSVSVDDVIREVRKMISNIR